MASIVLLLCEVEFMTHYSVELLPLLLEIQSYCVMKSCSSPVLDSHERRMTTEVACLIHRCSRVA
jgi:hypothetical protein